MAFWRYTSNCQHMHFPICIPSNLQKSSSLFALFPVGNTRTIKFMYFQKKFAEAETEKNLIENKQVIIEMCLAKRTRLTCVKVNAHICAASNDVGYQCLRCYASLLYSVRSVAFAMKLLFFFKSTIIYTRRVLCFRYNWCSCGTNKCFQHISVFFFDSLMSCGH